MNSYEALDLIVNYAATGRLGDTDRTVTELAALVRADLDTSEGALDLGPTISTAGILRSHRDRLLRAGQQSYTMRKTVDGGYIDLADVEVVLETVIAEISVIEDEPEEARTIPAERPVDTFAQLDAAVTAYYDEISSTQIVGEWVLIVEPFQRTPSFDVEVVTSSNLSPVHAVGMFEVAPHAMGRSRWT